jgi:hypothetical protein
MDNLVAAFMSVSKLYIVVEEKISTKKILKLE